MEPQVLLQIYAKEGQELSLSLLNHILWCLWTGRKGITLNTREMWIPVLMQNWRDDCDCGQLEYLLFKLLEDGDTSLAFFILDHLFEPKLNVGKYKEIYFFISEHKAKKLVAKLEPHFPKIAMELCELLVYKLKKAHELSVIYTGSTSKRSNLVARPAIEAHEQNWMHNKIDFLIDIFRDTSIWVQVNNHSHPEVIRERLINSEVPLFRRIATHMVYESIDLNNDEKMAWLITHDLIDDSAVYHEFYRLIGLIYPVSGDTQRRAFIEHVIQYNEGVFEHDLFNLFSWLESKCEDSCGVLKPYLDNECSKNPNRRVQRYPDLTSWSTGVRSGLDSPLEAVEIKAQGFDDLIRFINGFEEAFDGPRKEGLYYEVQKTVKDDPGWGIKFADYLVVRLIAKKNSKNS